MMMMMMMMILIWLSDKINGLINNGREEADRKDVGGRRCGKIPAMNRKRQLWTETGDTVESLTDHMHAGVCIDHNYTSTQSAICFKSQWAYVSE